MVTYGLQLAVGRAPTWNCCFDHLWSLGTSRSPHKDPMNLESAVKLHQLHLVISQRSPLSRCPNLFQDEFSGNVWPLFSDPFCSQKVLNFKVPLQRHTPKKQFAAYLEEKTNHRLTFYIDVQLESSCSRLLLSLSLQVPNQNLVDQSNIQVSFTTLNPSNQYII